MTRPEDWVCYLLAAVLVAAAGVLWLDRWLFNRVLARRGLRLPLSPADVAATVVAVVGSGWLVEWALLN